MRVIVPRDNPDCPKPSNVEVGADLFPLEGTTPEPSKSQSNMAIAVLAMGFGAYMWLSSKGKAR